MNIGWTRIKPTCWIARLDGLHLGNITFRESDPDDPSSLTGWTAYTASGTRLGSAYFADDAKRILARHTEQTMPEAAPHDPHDPPAELDREPVTPAGRPVIEWPKPTTPKTRTTITTAQLGAIVASSPFHDFQHIYTDSKYVALTAEEWNDVLAETNTRQTKYVGEVHDCDDYAKLCAGAVSAVANVNGIAIVLDFAGRHAYNAVLVDDDGTVSIQVVEPQRDSFVPHLRLGAKPYAEQKGICIW